jgi:hypothetical protein
LSLILSLFSAISLLASSPYLFLSFAALYLCEGLIVGLLQQQFTFFQRTIRIIASIKDPAVINQILAQLDRSGMVGFTPGVGIGLN